MRGGRGRGAAAGARAAVARVVVAAYAGVRGVEVLEPLGLCWVVGIWEGGREKKRK